MARRTVSTDQLMRPIAEFSLGLRVDDIIYIGATAGTDARRELAGYGPGRIDVAAQTSKMFRNMETALSLLGGGLEDVVRLKAYIDDVRDFAVYEDAAAACFRAPEASRAVVGSWGFPLPQAVVEADLVAVVGQGRRAARSGDRPAVGAHGRFHCASLPRAIPGEPLAPDIGLQTERTLERLAERLGGIGLSPADAVMLTVTLADLRFYGAFEDVFRSFFSMPYPARTIVAAPLSAPDLLVGIECIALAGGGSPVMAGRESRGAASPAMLAGDTLYISGELEPGDIAGSIEEQTIAAWQCIEALVREAGMALEDIVSTTNVLTDWRDYRGFNTGFARFVSPPYPPRTTISVGLLDPRARVQIEAVAHRNGRNAQVIEVTTP